MKTKHFIFIFSIALAASLFLAFWNFLSSQARPIAPNIKGQPSPRISIGYLPEAWAVPTMPDTVVISVNPPANSHIAPLTTTLAITFNQPIIEATVSTQTVFVHGDGHGHMDGSISFGSSSSLYDPAQTFFPGELVQTSVTDGVLDSNGVPITPFVWQFRAAVNAGSGTFLDSGQNLGSFVSRGVAVGDVDGDGDLDAYFAMEGADKLWLNDGMGNFTESGQSLDSLVSADVVLGDVDGDSDLDAFIVNVSQANKVWLNNGAGVFSDSGQAMGVATSTSVALGDVDGDGDLDALVGNWGQPNEVWLNDGTGAFTNSGQAMGTDITLAVALGDVDADGDLDAFFGNRDSSNKVWRNNGTGIFTNSGQNLGSDDTYAVALGDVDGDEDLDAFVGNLGGANKVWQNNGTGTFTNSGQNLGNEDTWAVTLGDVEGDGDLDAFVGNYFGQPDQVWLNNGAGTFTNSGQILGGSSTLAAALGDVDEDGDLDALIGNFNSSNKLWLNLAPEMDISGNGQSIPNGDITPSASDGTSFGSIPTTGGTVVHTFTIHNTGDAPLNLTGTPDVMLNIGTHFNVTIQPNSSVIPPGNTVTFEITFNPLASGTFSDMVIIANNDGDETPYTFTISGTGTNTPPLAVNDTYTTTEDVPLATTSPGVLDNDTDADGDPLTAVLDTPPSAGTLVLNSDGSFVYTPTLKYTGVITFTYIVSDGLDISEPVTVTIIVQAAPVPEFRIYLPAVIR